MPYEAKENLKYSKCEHSVIRREVASEMYKEREKLIKETK